MSGTWTWPTWTNLGLKYDHPEHLLTDQWGVKPELYVTYRWAASFYLLGWLIASIVEFTPPTAKYFLNVTSWSFILLTFTALARAILLTKFIRSGRPFCRMTCVLRLIWVCENVSAVMAIGVTIGYWTMLNRDGELPITGVTVHTHGVNAIYVIVDVLLTARPCRLFHGLHSMTFAFIYLLFTAIYWVAGGTGSTGQPYIYPSLDWRKPKPTLTFSFLFGCVLTLLVHAILCVTVFVRVWLYDQMVKRVKITKPVPEEEKELSDVYGA